MGQGWGLHPILLQGPSGTTPAATLTPSWQACPVLKAFHLSPGSQLSMFPLFQPRWQQRPNAQGGQATHPLKTCTLVSPHLAFKVVHPPRCLIGECWSACGPPTCCSEDSRARRDTQQTLHQEKDGEISSRVSGWVLGFWRCGFI